MTEDRIKAIAEEYAELNAPNINDEILRQDGIYLNATMVFEPFLRFLNDRYCIVEREKVMELYRDSEKLMDVYPSMSNGFANKLTTMEHLFGTSMFNENKE